MRGTHSTIFVGYQISCFLLAEIRMLKSISNPTDEDIEKMALLRVALDDLSPRDRYVWIDGRPVFDLWEELSKIEWEASNE